MREPREPSLFETQPTANMSEVVAVLWVNETYLRADTTITAGTTLQNFLNQTVPKPEAINRGFGSYLLTDTAGKRDGYHGYTFAKPKTAAQKRTAWRSTTKTRPVRWDNWLRNLYGGMAVRTLDKEAGSTGGGSTSNKVTRTEFVDRYELIPAGDYMTEVIVEEFLSPTAFTDFDTEVPVPTEVRYFYKGASLSLSCLHDDVFVPELSTGFTREEEFGMRGSQELQEGQFFPRTNFTGWQLYTISDNQELVNGVWRRVTERVNKLPPIPEALRF
jgi:hypothetical protein